MSLISEIDARVTDAHVRLALLLGALLEGGSLTGPWNAGDNGTSFGPYQIHLPAHPDYNAATASDPALALNWAIPAYTAAAKQVPASLWETNPQQAAAQTAYIAERPAYMYPASRVTSAWDALVNMGSAAGSSAGSAVTLTGNPISGAGGAIGGFFSGLWGAITGPARGAAAFFNLITDPHWWAQIGLTLGAAVMIVVGLVIFARPATPGARVTVTA